VVFGLKFRKVVIRCVRILSVGEFLVAGSWYLELRKVVGLGLFCVRKVVKNWYFFVFFCKNCALLCKNCVFFAIFLTILRKVCVFYLNRRLR